MALISDRCARLPAAAGVENKHLTFKKRYPVFGRCPVDVKYSMIDKLRGVDW